MIGVFIRGLGGLGFSSNGSRASAHMSVSQCMSPSPVNIKTSVAFCGNQCTLEGPLLLMKPRAIQSDGFNTGREVRLRLGWPGQA